ncbi:recombinase family protein [Bradyrhizobium sp. BWA-3-5]|uniref:recombinase family protein n=1 Tax=Bradyrhizobium sp. BWA-3-5 TaxID=3080013 RepID=UPI00293E5E54|nr:recombinase family protein [Bradyrhizobium sp. BWA-3-5]WOH67107.1 recombinase family protein [Bradyrhizobium sp. BWA-3-5]
MRRAAGTNKPTRSTGRSAPDFAGDRFMKVALYARYSSDNQRDASIADQFRVCRAYAEKQGWRVVEEYSDHAISGASLLRAGVQALITTPCAGDFKWCWRRRWIASHVIRKTSLACSSAWPMPT